ncbi:MAG: P1 family peptidase [Rhodospirillaceae bacterium]|nr:P1 family peptidase [Rhodospirillaceae bacterium]
MSKVGARNAITDVAGLKVGSADDADIRTGVTVVLPDARAVAAVDVQGGGTGTRELELLRGDATLDAVDAIVLGGGSAFGLSAADGVMGWLAEQGRGFPVDDLHVPIVPGAILFDLLNGGEKSAFRDKPDTALPYRALARAATENAGLDVALGIAGAGFGATTTGHDGRPLKGGQGTASVVLGDGVSVGALAAVNALGSVVANGAGQFLAGMLERDGEFGGLGGAPTIEAPDHPLDKYGLKDNPPNTTLAVVATDAVLSKAQVTRVARMAQAGMARAIRPVFTPMDGDVVFALATGQIPVSDPVSDVARIGMAAADCLARAVARSVFEASGQGDWPAYRDTYPVSG